MTDTLETSRLRLLPFTSGRIQDIHLVWSNEEAMFWSLSGPSKDVEASQVKLQKFLEPSDPTKRYDWLVYEKQTTSDPEPCIGMASIWRLQPQEPGARQPGDTWVVGYMLLKAFWGKGYATEMTEGMIQGIQHKIRPCTLQAYINRENPSSQKVAGKLGFTLVEKVYKPEEPKVWIGGEWREYAVWRYTRKLE